MTNNFSHSLNLIDLNDYLGPSQICIKPPNDQGQTPNQNQNHNQSISKTEIKLDHQPSSSSSNPISLQKAQITLNDCLACSGCITSSESILVSLQSVEQVLSEIEKPNRYPIISISPHSIASFATYNHLKSLSSGFKVLRRYFSEKLKFKLVLDTSFSQRLHLWEAQREYKKKKNSKVRSTTPILASSCPGWICYAEKTQAKNGILEMISRVKSAQQIQGSLIKSEKFATLIRVPIDQIYHVCLMSCYDKKLEASRSEFQNDQAIKEVDCVLTTREVQDLIERDGFDIHQATKETQEEDLNIKPSNLYHPYQIPIWIDHPQPKGSSTGGYLFNALRASISTEKNKLDRLKLIVDQKRGADYVEYRLQYDHSRDLEDNIEDENRDRLETLFYGARFYGFKNLQNLIRKIAPPSSQLNGRLTSRRRRQQSEIGDTTRAERNYDFVEVMACPSGCVNGGGQIPIAKLINSAENMSNKQAISVLERIYFSPQNDNNGPQKKLAVAEDVELPKTEANESLIQELEFDSIESQEHQFILDWFRNWGLDDEDSPSRDRIFLTSYKPVELESNGFAVQW